MYTVKKLTKIRSLLLSLGLLVLASGAHAVPSFTGSSTIAISGLGGLVVDYADPAFEEENSSLGGTATAVADEIGYSWTANAAGVLPGGEPQVSADALAESYIVFDTFGVDSLSVLITETISLLVSADASGFVETDWFIEFLDDDSGDILVDAGIIYSAPLGLAPPVPGTGLLFDLDTSDVDYLGMFVSVFTSGTVSQGVVIPPVDVPEPGTLGLLAIGVLALVWRRRAISDG